MSKFDLSRMTDERLEELWTLIHRNFHTIYNHQDIMEELIEELNLVRMEKDVMQRTMEIDGYPPSTFGFRQGLVDTSGESHGS